MTKFDVIKSPLLYTTKQCKYTQAGDSPHFQRLLGSTLVVTQVSSTSTDHNNTLKTHVAITLYCVTHWDFAWGGFMHLVWSGGTLNPCTTCATREYNTAAWHMQFSAMSALGTTSWCAQRDNECKQLWVGKLKTMYLRCNCEDRVQYNNRE